MQDRFGKSHTERFNRWKGFWPNSTVVLPTKWYLLNQFPFVSFSGLTKRKKKRKIDWRDQQNRTKKKNVYFWTVWVLISRHGALFECLPNTPHLFPRMLLFFVWCWGYCFKRQLLFLLSGKLSSFTSPEMKAKSRLWDCSLKTPRKRDLYHHSSVWELHFPCFPLIRAEGFLLVFL